MKEKVENKDSFCFSPYISTSAVPLMTDSVTGAAALAVLVVFTSLPLLDVPSVYECSKEQQTLHLCFET